MYERNEKQTLFRSTTMIFYCAHVFFCSEHKRCVIKELYDKLMNKKKNYQYNVLSVYGWISPFSRTNRCVWCRHRRYATVLGAKTTRPMLQIDARIYFREIFADEIPCRNVTEPVGRRKTSVREKTKRPEKHTAFFSFCTRLRSVRPIRTRTPLLHWRGSERFAKPGRFRSRPTGKSLHQRFSVRASQTNDFNGCMKKKKN